MKPVIKYLPRTDSPKAQRGFTLVEIAIVLVIIGLLLGGVLQGQELINSAKVRSLNNTVEGITSAWYGYQDRYRAFPGDYNAAATNIPALGAIAIANGNGSGTVQGATERTQLWVQLAAAGFISGSYDAGTVNNADYRCPTGTCPDNGFGIGMSINYGTEILQAGASSAHELISGRSIPVEILSELDRKIDDGFANSGSMQLGNGGSGWNAAASTACFNTPGYQVLTPSANCAAVFRNF
ncbi:MAG: prepilin-type N-terminal cleavage/methylation domain-containing protein [Gammaproteobacteria bacterium]|nr:prepilin-type N-terminal cleavage/methylation domain-containing protein [Gammaproteobacteria bacterium]